MSYVRETSSAYKLEYSRLRNLFERRIKAGEERRLAELEQRVRSFSLSAACSVDPVKRHGRIPHSPPAGYHPRLQQNVYEALREHMQWTQCSCPGSSPHPSRTHPLHFLLERVKPATKDGTAHFELLIGSRSEKVDRASQQTVEYSSNMAALLDGFWQDVCITSRYACVMVPVHLAHRMLIHGK
jgi:hypothetical protein